MDRIKLKDKVLVVTGAAQGIGRAVAMAAADQGAIVIAIDAAPAAQEALRGQIGPRGEVHIADVRDRAAMQAVMDQLIARFGGIDVVIANAGIERVAPMVDMDPQDFMAVIDVNITGVYNTVQPALASVIARRGHVMAISSVAGLIPFPLAVAYSTSKAAVDMMMRVLRMELSGTGATAGAAYFGFVQTEMANRIFSDAVVRQVVDRLPSRLLGVKPLPRTDRIARLILRGVRRRRAHVFAPMLVGLTFRMRGLYPALDGFLARYVMRIGPLIEELRQSRK